MLEPSSRLLKSLGLEAEGLDRAPSESRPKGGRVSRLIMERSDPDSVGRQQQDVKVLNHCCRFEPLHAFRRLLLPLLSSFAFCVARSASQCSAELLPSPADRGSLAEDWLGEAVPLVLPTVSPPPVSVEVDVCVVSILIGVVSPSDFGAELSPDVAAARTPPPAAVGCVHRQERNVTTSRLKHFSNCIKV